MKNKVKGLLISADRFPPWRVDVKVLFAEQLSQKGFEFDWVLQSKESIDKSYCKNYASGVAYVGRTHVGSRLIDRFKKHFFAIINEFKVFSILKTKEYDFIQVKDKVIAALVALYSAKKYKTKCYYWLSFPFPENSLYRYQQNVARYPLIYWFRGTFQYYLLYKFLLPKMDHVFVQSERMKEDLIKKGISQDKLTPVPMGVDNKLFDFDAVSVFPEEPVVVYLGAMDKARGLAFVLQTFKNVHNKIPGAKLWMIGGSEEPEALVELKQEAKKLGIDNATWFTGQMPMTDAINLVKQARVGISPFKPSPVLDSTSPTKLIEYMACGIPVVANTHPEQSRVIKDSEFGLAVEWSHDAFSNAVIDLLNLNKQEWNEMSLKGKKYARENRTYTVISDKLAESYRRLLNDTGKKV